MANDPFTNPSERDPSAPPPPPLGAPPQAGWAAAAPTGLATATIWLTGAYTVLTLGQTALTVSEIDVVEATGQNSAGGQALVALSQIVAVASYVVVALWMTAIYRNLVSTGVAQPLSRLWAWFAWLIPLANYVLPFIYMRGLNQTAKSNALWPWWLAWCGMWTVSFASGIVLVGGLNFDALANDPEASPFKDGALDGFGAYAWASSVLLVIAWVFLTKLVRDINARHLPSPAGFIN